MKVLAAFGGALGIAGGARADMPMDYLWTAGPAADPVTRLNWGLIAVSLSVVAVIVLLVLIAVFRRRPPMVADASGRLPVLPERGGMAWLYVGVGISSAVLLACTIWTFTTLSAIAAPHGRASMTVEVVGHQFWWEVIYHGSEPAQRLITANEIHIPVGQPVLLRLRSDDVIHSFWVPKLAGKTDVIPGKENTAWIQAARAGTYRGQCAEFCGAQHAHMALHVVAQAQTEFDAWRKHQREQAAASGGGAARGMQVFHARCAECHSVRGTPAAGRKGPDLTHLMSRATIAAGTLPNNTGSLAGWIANAQAIKPGSRMPGFELDPQDLHAVVDYLQTLQ